MDLHRTTIELDREKLAAVAAALGTRGIKPTVDAAFDEIIRTHRRARDEDAYRRFPLEADPDLAWTDAASRRALAALDEDEATRDAG